MNIVNLTPHPISFLVNEETGECLKVQPSGIVARAGSRRIQVQAVNGLRVVRQVLGAPQELPEPEEGTIFVVSGMALQAMRDLGESDRDTSGRVGRDVFAPDTGPDAIRDHTGQIVAVRGLVC